MNKLGFKDCYANKLDLSIKEITNGKYLVSRTAYNKRINAEMGNDKFVSIIVKYRKTKWFPETKEEKTAYAKAYNYLCDEVMKQYKENLKKRIL